MTIVIAGGGLAALRTAESLRLRGYTGKIVVAADEVHMPYNRTPLSKEVLWGEVELADLVFDVSERVSDVEWRLGNSVVAADLDQRIVTLADGTSIEFDGLVAATGVTSRRFAVEGPEAGRVVLRNIEDVAALKGALREGTRVVILGAGFIGCEVAATARSLGCEVDVVAIDQAPMAIPLGVEVGSEIQRRHESSGIRFHLGHTIVQTKGDTRLESVVLDDGTVLPADMLLESIGSIPNTQWLQDNNLDLTNGVLCDEYLRAGGRRGIVAVGDVARFANPMFDAPPMRIEHWQTAIDSAAFASRILLSDLGLSAEEPPPVSIMPWFWSDQGSVRLTSYGMLGLADRIEIIEGELSGECAISYLRDGNPTGVLLLGMKSKSARYKRWLGNARKSVSKSAGVGV